jgi:hypothetical protein
MLSSRCISNADLSDLALSETALIPNIVEDSAKSALTSSGTDLNFFQRLISNLALSETVLMPT